MLDFPYPTVLTIPVQTGSIEVNVDEHFVLMNVHFNCIVIPTYIWMSPTASAEDRRPLIKAKREFTSQDAQITVKDDRFVLLKLNLDGVWYDVHGTPPPDEDN